MSKIISMTFSVRFEKYFLILSVSHHFMDPKMSPTNPKIWSKMKIFTKIIKNQQKLIIFQIPATDLWSTRV